MPVNLNRACDMRPIPSPVLSAHCSVRWSDHWVPDTERLNAQVLKLQACRLEVLKGAWRGNHQTT